MEEKKDKIVRWNLAKEGGWQENRQESEKVKDKLENILNYKELTIDEAQKKFYKVHDYVKYKAFGKVTIRENQT